MKESELHEALEYVNHSRANRLKMARSIMENPALVDPLLDIAYSLKEPLSSRACWSIEFAARQDLRFLDNYLDKFINGMSKVKSDSSVRPVAKICELLILEYYGSSPQNNPSNLSHDHLEHIATACFDWLIEDQKVAPKAYSMTCLYHLGKTFGWIHPELKMVLENNYANGSAGYKARARKILAKL